jgi:hypothetical protein
MKRIYFSRLSQVILFLVITVLSCDSLAQTTLNGNIGSSGQYGSGWIDLFSMQNFKKGDNIRLTIGGSAQKILVRLLSAGQFPEQPVGILPGKDPEKGNAFVTKVPINRIVLVKLDSSYSNVIQISVHGGPNPWGQFPLGASNGPATIINAEVIR